MRTVLSLLVAIALVNLAACGSSSSDLRYLDSRVLPPLEVPPDLTTANTESESTFELPAVFSGESNDPESRKKIPVLAKVEALKLEGFADFYWLSLEAPVDELYQLVKEFWASEGFTLALDEPVIGIMETAWVFNEEGKQEEDQGFFARLFASEDLSASQDQFRTRIAREGADQGVRIYISHRGTEIIYTLPTRPNENYIKNNWNFRQSDTELEVEMLSRLMIYLGLRHAEIEQQLENVKLFAARASFHTDYVEEESYLLVQGGYTRSWNRILHQLDRLNFEVVKATYQSGLSNDGVILINTNVDIEVEDRGFFSFFTAKTKTVKKQVVLVLSEETHETTRISIETPDGEVDNSPEGIEFLSLLYQYIK
ncbi:MAG: outer membrane protein assembly factor BamC [Proteobacteria bacterium]|nr:outer membrane protein assembly factor BamC [Pseudomonadota bacterium]